MREERAQTLPAADLSWPERLVVISMLVLWAALTFSSALVEISSVAALVFWLFLKIRTRTFFSSVLPKLLLIPAAAFVLLSMLTYFWSEYPPESFRGVFKLLQQFMIFWMAADCLSSRRAKKLFETTFLLVFAVLISNGVFQYLTGHDFLRGFAGEPSSSGLRVSASFKSYGALACYLISTVPLAFAYGLRRWRDEQKRPLGAVFILVAVMGCILLLLTRSRGAFIAFALGAVVFLIWARKFTFLIVLAALLGALLIVLPRSMIIHLDAEGKEQSLVERFYLWDRALQVIEAKPLTGTGINTYTQAHAKYDKHHNWRVPGYYAHNGFLQLAAETGLPNLFLFLLFLGLYFWDGFKGPQARAPDQTLRLGLLIGILNFLILATVDTVLHNPQPVMTLWYLMGLQLAYRPKELI